MDDSTKDANAYTIQLIRSLGVIGGYMELARREVRALQSKNESLDLERLNLLIDFASAQSYESVHE